MSHEINLNEEFARYEFSISEETYQKESRRLAQIENGIVEKLLAIELPESQFPGIHKSIIIPRDNDRIIIAEGGDNGSRVITLHSDDKESIISSIYLLHASTNTHEDSVRMTMRNFPEHYPELFFGIETRNILAFTYHDKESGSKKAIKELDELREVGLETVAFYFGMDGSRSKAHVYLGEERIHEDVRGSKIYDVTHTIVEREVERPDLEIAGMALNEIRIAMDELINS